MAVHGIDHINIRTGAMESTLAFLRDTLGLVPRPVQGLNSMEKVAWVCDSEGHAVLHIVRADSPNAPGEPVPDAPPFGSGAIHHVALNCSGHNEMRERIVASGVHFRERHVTSLGLRQLFVEDPAGILYELNFSDE